MANKETLVVLFHGDHAPDFRVKYQGGRCMITNSAKQGLTFKLLGILIFIIYNSNSKSKTVKNRPLDLLLENA